MRSRVSEYNRFLRPSNGTETEWIPMGSMSILRDVSIAKAVYEVEEELVKQASANVFRVYLFIYTLYKRIIKKKEKLNKNFLYKRPKIISNKTAQSLIKTILSYSYSYSRSGPLILLANCISLTINVTRLACIAQR